MFEHLAPKERLGYLVLGAVALGGVTYVGAQRLKSRPSLVVESPGSISPGFNSPTAKRDVVAPSPPTITIKVHVVGAVKASGVYSFSAEDRVQDAIAKAGGAAAEADLEAVNLAARLTDGTQLVVPKKGATPKLPDVASTPYAAHPEKVGSSPKSGGKHPTAIVNLNTATAEQLCTISGIGESTAEKILEYRRQHGGFTSVEELTSVKGIGEKKLAKMRPWLTVK